MLSSNSIRTFFGSSACAMTLFFSGCAVQSGPEQRDVEPRKDMSPIEVKEAGRSDSAVNLREIF